MRSIRRCVSCVRRPPDNCSTNWFASSQYVVHATNTPWTKYSNEYSQNTWFCMQRIIWLLLKHLQLHVFQEPSSGHRTISRRRNVLKVFVWIKLFFCVLVNAVLLCYFVFCTFQVQYKRRLRPSFKSCKYNPRLDNEATKQVQARPSKSRHVQQVRPIPQYEARCILMMYDLNIYILI